jgi:hypothetical protein
MNPLATLIVLGGVILGIYCALVLFAGLPPFRPSFWKNRKWRMLTVISFVTALALNWVYLIYAGEA